MASINLTEEPTFELKVAIPRVGRPDAEVVFTFKHRTVDEFQKLLTDSEAGAHRDMTDEQVVMMLAQGWELKDEFTEANVRLLCQQYQGAGPAIAKAYFREFARARLGN